jgi:hypothetical protein
MINLPGGKPNEWHGAENIAPLPTMDGVKVAACRAFARAIKNYERKNRTKL